MATPLDLISAAMRKLGALAVAQSPSADEGQMCFYELNRMLDAWNTQRNTAYVLGRAVYTLIPGQQTYQLGPSSPDWVGPRPQQLETATMRLTDNAAQPIDVPRLRILNKDQWAALALKNVASTFPQVVYFESSFPNARLSFWPIPTQAESVVLYTWDPLVWFGSQTDVVSFPPGYEDCIVWNLAIRLGPDFGKEPSQVVVAHAQQAMEWLKSLNVEPKIAYMDAALGTGGVWDWRTGETR